MMESFITLNIVQSMAMTIMFMEVIKRFLKASWPTIPSWVYSLVMIPVSIALTWLVESHPALVPYFMSVAGSQFGYQFMVEELLALFKKFLK